MMKKQQWNQLRRLRRKTHEDRMERALLNYFDIFHWSVVKNTRTSGFTDKGYLKRRVEQPLEYTNGR